MAFKKDLSKKDNKLEEFTEFLKTVDLGGYRKQYAHIKIVEMDLVLPKKLCDSFGVKRMDIQAINLLYKVYWEEKNFISFDEFYDIYLKEKKELLEAFREYVEMCESCFYRGLKARIYRTWAGLITQIHGGYVAESVFGEGSVEMSRELDSLGADIRVNYGGKKLNYQVKKASYSGVMSRKPLSRRVSEGENIDIYYEVPNSDIFDNPKTKKGEVRTGYKRFMDDKRTDRLPNGFIIFTKDTFLPKKEEIDSK
ncbi:MAG: TaqI family restriction endonuclease [archaeon]